MQVSARAPLRVSFAGGGTDIVEYYEQYGGAVLSMTIRKYARVNLPAAGLIWDCDCAPGSGLGGSSALAVAAVAALTQQRGEIGWDKEDLIRRAHRLERDVLGVPGGVQDHAAAAFGGLNLIRFSVNGITAERLPDDAARELADRLLLVDTGVRRTDLGLAAKKTVDCRRSHLHPCFESLRLCAETMDFLARKRDWKSFGINLRDAWTAKMESSPGCSFARADELMAAVLAAGAGGAKICGAGGGGHVLVMVELSERPQVLEALGRHGAVPQPVEFEPNGVTVSCQEPCPPYAAAPTASPVAAP